MISGSSRRMWGALSALLVVLAGCTVGPETQPTVPGSTSAPPTTGPSTSTSLTAPSTTTASSTTSTPPTTTTTSTVPRPPVSDAECSASDLALFREEHTLDVGPLLPDWAGPAAATRDALIDAALACDFERVASLVWTEAPPDADELGLGTFWGEPTLSAQMLQRLDETQSALWDLAVALIYTQPVWDFYECEDPPATEWYCGLEWYSWPWSRGAAPESFGPDSGFVPDQLERLALLDGTTPAEFADRLRAGYSTFGVVISLTGDWVAAHPPAPGECPTEPGSPIDLTDEPDWRRLFPWTDVLGCPVRVDVLYERTGPDHCGWEETRVLVTGHPVGARFQPHTNDAQYVRDPDGLYGDRHLAEGFARLDGLPIDAVYTGFRLRDRELWTSPSDPDAIYINSADGVERWPRGEPPLCA